ncbi:ABC transporter substrate-binding protein [Candidatus Poriferisodalis sp.]|uniref:ABC transporter substrate-binding protein n=1 Tax=Candidatus Poriferisodalis sp. TaxID=3101277 RepID=UPI003B02ADF1
MIRARRGTAAKAAAISLVAVLALQLAVPAAASEHNDERSERQALEELFAATGGDNWSRNDLWGSGAPLGQWHGVTTDGDGRVVRLELQSNGLSGELPEAIGQLTRLQRLDLGDNGIHGEIPRAIGELTDLRELDLQNNRLYRQIPAEIGELTNLTLLDVKHNALWGRNPVELWQLDNLRVLDMRGNRMSGPLPSELGEMTQLSHLVISDNLFWGELPAEIGQLGNLAWLDVSRNSLSGELPAEIGDLASLTWLDASNNTLSGEIPAEVGNLGELITLDLRANQLTGPIPAELGGLGELEYLVISENRLSGELPAEIGQLAELRHLRLEHNSLGGALPPELGDLGELRYLRLESNQLTGQIPSEVGQLARLKELRLERNRLTGDIPSQIGELGKLQALNLGDNQLSGTIPAELADAASLAELRLDRNLLTGRIPSALGALTKLKHLDLSDNVLYGQVPYALWDLTELRELRLNDNELSGPLKTAVANLTELTELDLSNNLFSGQIPVTVGHLAKLRSLRMANNELSGSIPSSIGRLGQLRSLDLSRNSLTGTLPGGLARLAQLQQLVVHDNQLSGEIPAELSGLDELRNLDLSRNALTGHIPPELGGMDNLERISLSFNELDGPIPTEFGDLANLRILFLRYNALSGEIPAELGNLSSLTRLNLWHNELTGPIPAELGNLVHLARLDLDDNQLSGEIPAEIGNLVELTEVWLRGNELTGPIPVELGNLTKLRRLYLDGNQLTGAIPDEFGNLSSLRRLWLQGNQLSGPIPAGLAALADLEQIMLGGTNTLSGCIPADWRYAEFLADDLDSLGLSFCPSEQDLATQGIVDELRRNAADFSYEIGTHGGALTLATISEPLTFNLALSNDAGSSNVLGYLFEGLTETSWLDDTIEPELAESWESSDDGLRWVFHLRDDVRWNDGTPFTAHDVDFTFNQVIYNDDFNASSRGTFEFRYLNDDGEWEASKMTVAALDDHTVEFVLPQPFAPFLRSMGTSIYPKHIFEGPIEAGTFTEFWNIDTDPTEIVGTGPFTIGEYTPEERVVFKRNPHYWKTDANGQQLPYLDQVVHMVVPDLESELALFRDGTADFHGVLGEEYALLEPLQENENFALHRRGPGFGTTFLTFNQNPGSNDAGEPFVDPAKLHWFGNVNFRQAVAHTLDKAAMIDGIQHGLGYEQWSSVSPAAGDFHNPDVRRYPYDIDRANDLLDDLGWIDTDGDGIREDDLGNPISFTLVTNTGNAVRQAATEIIRDGMAEAGLDVTYEAIEFRDLVSQLTATYDWEAMVIGFTGGPDPYSGIGLWHSSQSLHLWRPFQDEPATDWEAEIDRLYIEASRELDHDKRVRLYREAQAIIAANVPLIYTTLGERLGAVRNVFGNTTPTLYGYWDIRYLYRTDR